MAQLCLLSVFLAATLTSSLKHVDHYGGEDRAVFEHDNAADTVHLCSVAMGTSVLDELELLVRSLKLQNPRQPLQFHIITDDASRASLSERMTRSGFKFDTVIPDEKAVMQWIRQAKVYTESHHSGYAGLAKVFMFKYLPNVRRCIVHDTDMYFGHPATELWEQFKSFGKDTMIAATWRPDHAAGDKINAGVMLMDFEKMRQHNFADLLNRGYKYSIATGRMNIGGMVHMKWPEQELLEGVLDDNVDHDSLGLRSKPRALMALDDNWNLEMCRSFYGFCQKPRPGNVAFKLGHFNCAKDKGYVQPDARKKAWWRTDKWKEFTSCFKGIIDTDAVGKAPL